MIGQVQANGQVFLLPDLGEGLEEAELVSWLVAVGESVHVDQPIAEVETAKSVVEVPSPFEGTVAVLHGAAGDTVKVGKPLITISSAGIAEPELHSVPEDSSESAPIQEPGGPGASGETGDTKDLGAPVGSGHVLIGYGTAEPDVPGRRRPGVRQAALVISPLVRKLAQDHGLVLADMRGSGSDGLILRSDVEAAITSEQALAQGPVRTVQADAQQPRQPQDPVGGPMTEASGVVDQRTGLPVVARKPLTGLKKAAAAALVRSRREIPDATVWVDVDATELVELRRGLKEKGAAPSVLAFIARFVIAGLGRFPELNMQLDGSDGANELVEFAGINLGFATQTERGLVVPVLRNAQGRTARELDVAIGSLTDRALGGHSGPAELAGGTFTINNYGVLGVDGSAAIINHPEAAMLGLGRIMDKPWVVDGQLSVRKMTELTLAFDHRVCDGAVAAGFLRFVADAVENPAGVLPEL